jgi:DNA-binding HxlR family transcriptional regulator
MLAQTLQVPEGDGLVLRQSCDVVRPHVEYGWPPRAAAPPSACVCWPTGSRAM